MAKNKSAPQNGTTSTTQLNNSPHTIDTKGETRILAAIHLLTHPEGVTEFSINRAANCMSGRNYPTDFEREQGVTLIKRRVKNQLTGKSHTEYRIANQATAERLAKYILHMQRRYHCHLIGPDELAQFVGLYSVELEVCNV